MYGVHMAMFREFLEGREGRGGAFPGFVHLRYLCWCIFVYFLSERAYVEYGILIAIVQRALSSSAYVMRHDLTSAFLGLCALVICVEIVA